MTTLSKILLAVAVTGLPGGVVIDAGGGSVYPALTVVLPISVIAFGLFLIVFMMQKEVSLFDIEQKNKSKSPPSNTMAAKPQSRNPPRPFIPDLKGKAL